MTNKCESHLDLAKVSLSHTTYIMTDIKAHKTPKTKRASLTAKKPACLNTWLPSLNPLIVDISLVDMSCDDQNHR